MAALDDNIKDNIRLLKLWKYQHTWQEPLGGELITIKPPSTLLETVSVVAKAQEEADAGLRISDPELDHKQMKYGPRARLLLVSLRILAAIDRVRLPWLALAQKMGAVRPIPPEILKSAREKGMATPLDPVPLDSLMWSRNYDWTQVQTYASFVTSEEGLIHWVQRNLQRDRIHEPNSAPKG
jgi:hypothetical protein